MTPQVKIEMFSGMKANYIYSSCSQRSGSYATQQPILNTLCGSCSHSSVIANTPLPTKHTLKGWKGQISFPHSEGWPGLSLHCVLLIHSVGKRLYSGTDMWPSDFTQMWVCDLQFSRWATAGPPSHRKSLCLNSSDLKQKKSAFTPS